MPHSERKASTIKAPFACMPARSSDLISKSAAKVRIASGMDDGKSPRIQREKKKKKKTRNRWRRNLPRLDWERGVQLKMRNAKMLLLVARAQHVTL